MSNSKSIDWLVLVSLTGVMVWVNSIPIHPAVQIFTIFVVAANPGIIFCRAWYSLPVPQSMLIVCVVASVTLSYVFFRQISGHGDLGYWSAAVIVLGFASGVLKVLKSRA